MENTDTYINNIIEELKKTLIKNGVKDLSSYDRFFECSKQQFQEKKIMIKLFNYIQLYYK